MKFPVGSDISEQRLFWSLWVTRHHSLCVRCVPWGIPRIHLPLSVTATADTFHPPRLPRLPLFCPSINSFLLEPAGSYQRGRRSDYLGLNKRGKRRRGGQQELNKKIINNWPGLLLLFMYSQMEVVYLADTKNWYCGGPGEISVTNKKKKVAAVLSCLFLVRIKNCELPVAL